MKIAIIGAGVVGVTTAFMLARAGHDVLVFDREPGIALESSYANGGQLSYGFASPMGSPSLIRKLPGIALGRDPAFRLPLPGSTGFVGWGTRFLRESLPARARRNAGELARLAARSGDLFKELVSEVAVEFGHRKAGKLVLVQSSNEVDAVRQDPVTGKRALNWDECVALEPALHGFASGYAGGIWVQDDEVGDAARFSEGLAKHTEACFGGQFLFNRDVAGFERSDQGGWQVQLSSGEQHGVDRVVVCTGTAGTALLRQHSIRLPIFPVVGYSLTAPLGSAPPSVAITDAAHKIVISRIADQIRIAGFADFGTASEERRRQRVQQLINTARAIAPDVAEWSAIRSTWVGARPATPSSLPIVKETKVPGLYLNMGHGMFGWTLSAAAASRITEMIGPASTLSQAA